MEFTYDENEPIDIEIDSEYIDSWKYTKKIERKFAYFCYDSLKSSLDNIIDLYNINRDIDDFDLDDD